MISYECKCLGVVISPDPLLAKCKGCLCNEIQSLRTENEQLRELLRACEWFPGGGSLIDWEECPICKAQNKPHKEDCRLAKAIGEE